MNPETMEEDEKKADPTPHSGRSSQSRRKRDKGKVTSNANTQLSGSERNQVDEQGRNLIEQKMYAQIRKRCLPILRTLISYTIQDTKITNNGAIRRAASESLIKVC